MSCIANPDYGNYSDPLAIAPDVAFYDSATGYTCYPSIGNAGTVTVNGGDPNKLNTILSSVLSGFALLQHAPYVPTANNPYNQPVVTPVVVAGGGGGNLKGGVSNSNASITAGTLGKAEVWIKANPGASAVIGLIFAALVLEPMMKKGR